MYELLEILKYTIPALVVFATAYFIIKSFIENEQKKKLLDLRSGDQKLIMPIRLQAYERLTLFLERISAESIIMRVQKPEMLSKQLQAEILSTIRAEFEHNLSQQIYISSNAWEVIKSAKENMIKLINTAGDKIKPDAPALELSRAILEMVVEAEKSPTTIAVEFLKKEIKQFY